MSQTSTFKKGQSVKFQARSSSGLGKITAIRTSERGLWYDVRASDGREISLRAANLKAV